MPALKDPQSIRGPDEDGYYSSSHPSDADDELTQVSTGETEDTYTDLNAAVDALDISREASPTPSFESYQSSVDDGVLLKDVHGRVMSNTSDTYGFPVDVPEHRRLDLQHEMLKRIQKGLFFAAEDVHRALAPRARSEPRPAVLDLGFGSGSWMVDMAKAFPHADIVGIDLAPAHLADPIPSNCRFECDDINMGLLHYRGAFDVVHASCVYQGITNYRKLLDEIAEVLRPGGVFLAVDGDPQLWDENLQPIHQIDEGEPGFSWTNRFLLSVRDAMKARGPGVDEFPCIFDWIEEEGELWQSKGRKDIFVPLGPWKDNMTEDEKYIAEAMQQNFIVVVDSVRPLLLSYGFFEETVDTMATRVKEEVRDMKFKHHIWWQFEWAVKSKEVD